MTFYYSCRFEMAAGTHVFLSHNWGYDQSGRDNHTRVSLVNEELKRIGYKTWFDEEKMVGNVAESMSEGIQETKVVIVFITRKYYEKVNGENSLDNCRREFIYTVQNKTPANMIAVVMEESMRNTKTWTGLIGFDLSANMYVDMSGDLDDRTYLMEQMKRLQKELESKGIQPLQGILFLFPYLV